MNSRLLGLRFLFMNREARQAKLLPFDNCYDAFKKVCKQAITKLHVDLEVKGTNYIPLYDGCFFIGNHAEIYDFLFIISANPNRSYLVVNKCDLKSNKLKKWYKLLNSIYSTSEISKKVEATLRTQKNVTCFISEELSHSNEILEIKPNGILGAMNAKAPIVPFVIIDSYKFKQKKKVKVVYAQPIHYEEYQNYSLSEIIDKVSNIMKETLIENM